MDILFHIAIFIGLGFLFYVYLDKEKKDRGIAPLILIIMISVLMFAITWQDPTYITTGYNTTATYVNNTIVGSVTTPIKTNFAFEWSLYLAYAFLFVMASMLSFMGDKYE